MRTLSALWQAYQAQTAQLWVYEHQAIIDGVTYADDEMWEFSGNGGLIADAFGIGNCIIQQLSISVVKKAAIAKNAQVELFVRINGANGATEWVTLGKYFISSREDQDGGRYKLNTLDRLAYADTKFLQDGETLDTYPMPMTDAVARILSAIGTTLDSRTTINGAYSIEYPNDLTMREVLENIAKAHGGNFCMTEDDKLRLVVPGYGTVRAAINSGNATDTRPINVTAAYNGVSMIYTEDGAYYQSGSAPYLELDMPWATQAMCDAVAAALNGYAYTPYRADDADFDPAIELGDTITINGVNCNVWARSWNSRMYYTLTCPSTGETNADEFGYTGSTTRAISRKVTLGGVYYGTTISRKDGIKVVRTDGLAEAVFNADVFAMRAKDDTGTMQDCIYFDPASKRYIFVGTLETTVMEAIQAVVTNSFTAAKGTIAELTVDQLDTSNKVQNYLSSSTADVNYIKIAGNTIQFVTASTTGAATEQATDRNSNPLYWTDDTKVSVTTDETAYPVTVYQYTEAVKMEISFEDVAGTYVPKLTLGQGSGTGDYGKGYIYKGVDGLYIEYLHSQTGESRIIKLTDDGIDLTEYEAIKMSETVTITGVPQIWVQADQPSTAKAKDLWVDTDDYSRYDRTALTGAKTLLVSDDEVITASGTFTITLHAATTPGIIKKVYNVGTGIVTIAGTINGQTNMLLYPGEGLELVTDGSGWRA